MKGESCLVWTAIHGLCGIRLGTKVVSNFQGHRFHTGAQRSFQGARINLGAQGAFLKCVTLDTQMHITLDLRIMLFLGGRRKVGDASTQICVRSMYE